ncbi:MAG: hypothetical protein LKJ57_04370 [Ancrocorticia sp.]|jgi:tight adherence protein B|nr:hypothetical protein [Ancrocorticia sp.]MCI1896052.1 hypothetical protein [Ancrocorticia sp.]MCI1932698.1 hypothetical protein [Ancrocorticia sp.]MCI1963786.1 hypothetical protein [Ancrocorticia sp.]MCI2002124.1 hypothetical protein [Ancrocorticia sp.]
MISPLGGIAAFTVLAMAWALTPLRVYRAAPRKKIPGRGKPRRKAFPVLRRQSQRSGTELDMGLLLTEVATRLRAGADMTTAWQITLKRAGFNSEEAVPDGSGVPRVLHNLAIRRKPPAGVQEAIAVCRLTQASGAPAADILDSCARGVADTAEAVAARNAALTGPVMSARLLALLPLAGFGLGALMGADPLAFLTGSLLGWSVLATGIALDAAGVLWIVRLARRAAQES